MKYRRFGRTGLQIPEVVFGAGFVGGILLGNDDDLKRQAIRRALDGGIDWIDTAPAYGDGRSEEALGWLLAEFDESPRLSTKFSVDPGEPDIPGQIERSLQASFARLRRGSVDLLQLHNRITPDGAGDRAVSVADVLGPGGIADGLDRLRAEGLTKFIGITAIGDAESCRQVVASGRFDSAQIYYNLINPSAGRAVPAGWSGFDYGRLIESCVAHDVAVMNIRVMAAGILATDRRTGREVPLARGSDVADEERRAAAVFQVLGREYGGRAEAAIRFALANPGVAGVLVGFSELSHIDEALAAAEKGPLPEAALARLTPLYDTDFGTL